MVRLNSCKGPNLRWKEPKGQTKILGPASVIKFLKVGPKKANLATLVKSARTVSRELYLEKRVYIGLTSYGQLRVLRQYFAPVQNLIVFMLFTTGLWHRAMVPKLFCPRNTARLFYVDKEPPPEPPSKRKRFFHPNCHY